MMKRSIVTTDVAVCFTTSQFLIGGDLREPVGGVPARVGFVWVTGISVTHRLPQVAEGKGPAFQKLVDVTKLVQEQLGGKPSAGSNEDSPPQRNRGRVAGSQRPAGNPHRKSTASIRRLRELLVLPQRSGGKLDLLSNQGSDESRTTCHLSPPASISMRAPSVRTITVPAWSVRSTSAPARESARRTSPLGCPYLLPAPTEITATAGSTAARNASLLLVALP